MTALQTKAHVIDAVKAASNPLGIRVAAGFALDVRQVDVAERISSLFEIRVLAHALDPSISLSAVAGAPAKVTMQTAFGGRHTWHGVCRDIRLVSAEDAGYSTYELVVVPVLWLATQREDYRIFQGMSELDIAEAILAEWDIQPEVRVDRAAYPAREFRVQYGESDYAFMCRMLEEAGICFFFEDGRKLVLADAPQLAEPRPALPCVGDISGPTSRECAGRLSVSQSVRPGRVTLRDHDFRRPAEFPLVVDARVGDKLLSRLERYQYEPGSFVFSHGDGDGDPAADDRGRYRADMTTADALVRRRLAAERAQVLSVSFETNAQWIAPGLVVGFTDHPHADLGEGRLVLVTDAELHATAEGQWRKRCRAVSAGVPYRPLPLTAKPRAIGVECATVVGPAGQEIHTDEFGRVRVHFHWDRVGGRDDGSSCWIHVSQPWSGTGFGGVNIPRIGQEVLVEFLGGDPDRPVILGRVYTKTQGVPYGLPAAKTKSGWRSMSSPGGGGYNELMFEDAAGHELVNVQAQKDMNTLVKHDETHTVNHDRTKSIGNDEQSSIGNNRTESVGNDEQIAIGNNRTESVGNNETVAIANDATTVIGNNLVEQVGVNRTRVVGVAESVKVGVKRTHDVGVSETITVGSSQSTKVGKKQSVKVGMLKTETVGIAKTQTCGAAYQVTVGGIMSTTVGAISLEKVGFLKKVSAGSKLELSCGAAKIILEASGKITLKGKEIVLDGADHVQVTSGRIDLN